MKFLKYPEKALALVAQRRWKPRGAMDRALRYADRYYRRPRHLAYA